MMLRFATHQLDCWIVGLLDSRLASERFHDLTIPRFTKLVGDYA